MYTFEFTSIKLSLRFLGGPVYFLVNEFTVVFNSASLEDV